MSEKHPNGRKPKTIKQDVTSSIAMDDLAYKALIFGHMSLAQTNPEALAADPIMKGILVVLNAVNAPPAKAAAPLWLLLRSATKMANLELKPNPEHPEVDPLELAVLNLAERWMAGRKPKAEPATLP